MLETDADQHAPVRQQQCIEPAAQFGNGQCLMVERGRGWQADSTHPERVGRGSLGSGDDLPRQRCRATPGDHGHCLAPVSLSVEGIALHQAVAEDVDEIPQDYGVALEEREEICLLELEHRRRQACHHCCRARLRGEQCQFADDIPAPQSRHWSGARAVAG